MRHVSRLALAVVFLTTACDQLLPNRAAQPVVAATPAEPAPDTASRPRPRRRPATPPDTSGVSESEAFSQIRRGLRRLVAAEQAFYAENGAYSDDLERLGYRMEGQTGVRFLWLKRDAWAASGTHPAIPGRDCVIFVGPTTAAPTSLKYVRNAREGVAACDDPPRAQRRPAEPRPPEPRPAADTASALDAVNPTIQMRVDLRNLVLSQNAYHATQGLYSRRIEPLSLQYFWHRGVKVDILSANMESWAGRATHSSRPGKSCVVWSGPVPVRPTTIAQRKAPAKPGVPVCDD